MEEPILKVETLACLIDALFFLSPFTCAQGKSPFYLTHPKSKIKIYAEGLGREENKHANRGKAEGREAK